jgi:hypothetical protein
MQPPTAPKKMTKNVCAKSKPEWKSSKAKKGKQPLQQTTMMQANPKYEKGKPMLTVDQLRIAGWYCADFHNYYIQNYKMGEDIMVQFKDRYFLLGDDIFVVTFFDLYDLFTFDALDISLILWSV